MVAQILVLKLEIFLRLKKGNTSGPPGQLCPSHEAYMIIMKW